MLKERLYVGRVGCAGQCDWLNVVAEGSCTLAGCCCDVAWRGTHHPVIDVLISNVAVSPAFGPFFDTTEDAWDKLFDINMFIVCCIML